MSTPVENNVDLTQFKALQEAFAPLIAANKAEKAEHVEEVQAKEVEKDLTSKLRPTDDIAHDTQRAVSQGTKGSPAPAAKWLGDGLTLYMLDNAPLLFQMSMQLRKTLGKAQVSMAKAHVETAFASAEMRIKQGEHEKQKCINQATSSFVSGGMGVAHNGMSIKDLAISKGTYQNNLAFRDNMQDLLTPSTAGVGAGVQIQGTVTPAVQIPSNSPQIAATLADGFASKYNERLAFHREKGQSSTHERGLGLTRQDQALVEHKAEMEARKAASSDAWKDLSEKLDGTYAGALPGNTAEMAALLKDPTSSAAFMDKLNQKAGGHDGVLSMLSGHSPSVSIAGVKSNIRSDIMRSFGKSRSQSAADLKGHLGNQRDTAAGRANHESTRIENDRMKRQLMAQIVVDMTTGATGIQTADDTMKSAEADAASRKDDAIAQGLASSRGALDGAIQGALERVQALESWYTQMQQQVAGAMAQSMA